MIRVTGISAHELTLGEARLDGFYYASDGRAVRLALESAGIPLQRLDEAAQPPFMGQRFARCYVQDPRFGVPFLGPSEMRLADLDRLPLVSRERTPNLKQLQIRRGWILLSRSGVVGNIAYVREDMDGLVGSDDLIRIIPRVDGPRGGYLYAFLCSVPASAMLRRSTYGGVIPHIEPQHIADLPIPRLDSSIELAIHERIEQAAAKRVEANRKLRRARARIYEITGLPRYERAPVGRNLAGARTFTVSHSSLGHRLEARYHDVLVREMQYFIRATGRWAELSEVTLDVHEEHRHKLFDAAENNLPFVGSGEMFSARAIPHRGVSKRIPGITALLVEPDTLLIAKSGQIYSILGDVVFVGRTLARFAVSWHALRIIPDPSRLNAGFLFAFLSLPDYGYGQIVATAFGTSIPELSTEDVKRIVVPVPNGDDADAIDQEVRSAIELRDEANDLEDEAQDILSRALAEALPVPAPSPDGHGGG